MKPYLTNPMIPSGTFPSKKLVRGCITAGLLSMVFWSLAACSADTTSPPAEVYTQQAMTLQAVLTDASVPSGASTPDTAKTTAAAGETQSTPMESTPADTLLPSPTATSLPTSAPTTIPCLRADFVSDVTIPDGTKINAGTDFTKTWKVRNSGSCEWKSDFIFALFTGDRMDGKDDTLGVNVPPGSEQNLSVRLTAPMTAGTHRGDWKIKNSQGTWFGVGPSGSESLFVSIVTVVLTPTITATPTISLTPSDTPLPTATKTPTPLPTSLSPTACPTDPRGVGYPPIC
jgi:hypothetical protein